MDWKAYGEAMAHSRHRVMGRELRPFCLYYKMWLRIIGSPFAGGKQTIGPEDVEMASRLCSCRFGGAEAALARRPGRLERWRVALRLLRPGALEREVAALEAYFQDTATGPDFQPGDGQAEEEFPDEMLAAAALMMHGHMSREEAWMLPLGEGTWLRAAFAKLQGSDPEIMTPREKAIFDHAKAKLERKNAARKRLDENWPDEKVFESMLAPPPGGV